MDADDEALSRELRALADAHGVTASYLDHGGVQRTAPRSSVLAVLEALGVEGAVDDPAGALAAHAATPGLLDAVVVLEGGEAPTSVPVAVRPGTRALECELVTEDGEATGWRAPLGDDASHPGGVVTRALALPRPLAAGYHALTVRDGAQASSAHVLARPAGGARGRFDDAWRAVGIAAPLFTLHSERSWGCGDLTDLDELAGLAAPHGASVVATLPLLAGFGPTPFDPSPYLPVSRQFWHERWLDVDAALDALGADDLAGLAADARRRARAAADAAHPYVDGEGSMRAQREVLEAAVAGLGDAPHVRAARTAYLADRPSVADYARFRAAGERHGIDWTRWPAALRDGRIRDGDVDAAVVEYHETAQWLADTQLRALVERLARRGQVLALDLPLGAHSRGYDVWRHQDQFLQGLSVGAPPDRFFPRGQVWGFPPPRVHAARADGHALFRAALVHHLNVAGMLRIDHVLGTQRLFCIPDGMRASDGLYVRMPLEELLAVVAIEAQRHRAAIVGEDLGTVDAAVRRAMQRDGVRRTSVVELAIKPAGTDPFVPPPAGAVASFSTHDLPTFEGWWRCRDVDERVSLGQVDAATGAEMRAKRLTERARLATLVGGTAAAAEIDVPDDPPPSGLLVAANRVLADGEAGVVVLQLDDVLGEREAVNLPGTSTERRNWQRRTALSLEAVREDPRLARALDDVHARRPEPEAATARAGVTVATRYGVTRFDDRDEARFVAGRHARLFDHLGAHPMEVDGQPGTYFAVWAPSAAWVEVVGDFNGWDGHRHPLARREASGIWEGFVPDVGSGERYKFRLASTLGGDVLDKADPFARQAELPPRTASIVHVADHAWGDAAWMAARTARQATSAPISVYEVHLGSWRRDPDDPSRLYSYGELAPLLAAHVAELGCTHVELLPVMEHPYYQSWGYQLSGYFAPTARYGSPDDFAAFVDELHRAGIGVLLDWVPGHFPDDEFALGCFDGTHLFEHPDPRMRVHPDWHSLIFNYARGEVRSFLMSAACWWLERYHADGLRFDAVASMLYLDFSRGDGEWVPNHLGGNENLDAVALLRACNEEIHRSYPGAITVAEESTAWPGVTAPVRDGGLGFDYKWDLGWMHDTLDYLHTDPAHRGERRDRLTFRSVYATSEQFVLPLSHDEVVHGKGSLYTQMAGADDRERLANLRLLFGLQLLQPGKKLLFMGDEFGQVREWGVDRALDWALLDDPGHAGLAALARHLAALYATSTPLHGDDLEDRGFRWLDADEHARRVFAVERRDGRGAHLVAVCNAGTDPQTGYVVGLPTGGTWQLACSSDEERFGGTGHPVVPSLAAADVPWQGRRWSAAVDVPALGFVIYAPG
ncbi:MAG TPA: 1,4-alpha-glucan branching protein GlgB [Acidimicrobiales bacterium]|nr:1,4-alpha-glucan branching protein GlgB [Acidimicrobiales bacterium]